MIITLTDRLEKCNLESLLEKANELEKRYEWLQATEFYEKAFAYNLKSNYFFRAAEIQAKMGFCYFKSAFQATQKSQFNKRIRLAVHAYEKAANHFGNSENEKKVMKVDNSKAMIAYTNSWLELDYSKTQKFLNEWWSLKSKVLKAHEKADDKFGLAKTCNDMMEGSIACRFWLGSNWKKSKRIRQELISLGERAISILTEIENKYELARAYCWTCYYYLVNNVVIADVKTDESKKGIVYSKKALKLSQETEDAWLIGWSNSSAAPAATQSRFRPPDRSRPARRPRPGDRCRSLS